MSTLIDDLLGEALTIRKKGNRTKNLRAVAGRVSRGVPEVMVKVTGFGKGGGHVKAHLTYISRHGDVELETESGEILDGKEAIADHFKSWQGSIEDSRQRKNQRDTMHLVLSMPSHVDEESVRRATREFSRDTFGENHRYVFALHTDGSNPHCHVTVLCNGRDGRKLNPRKADLQAWREAFAEKIREQGYEAEATPRRARGVVKKAQRAVIRHIETGDRTHKPRVSRVRAAKTKEAAKELAQGSTTNYPWESAIAKRQAKVRRSWLDAATALERQATPESAGLAVRIRKMVADMPTVETERQTIRQELKQRFRGDPEKAPQVAKKNGRAGPSKDKERDLER